MSAPHPAHWPLLSGVVRVQPVPGDGGHAAPVPHDLQDGPRGGDGGVLFGDAGRPPLPLYVQLGVQVSQEGGRTGQEVVGRVANDVMDSVISRFIFSSNPCACRLPSPIRRGIVLLSVLARVLSSFIFFRPVSVTVGMRS